MLHQVAKVSELSDNSMLAVKAVNADYVIFKTSDGKLAALEDRCSHANIKLSLGSYANDQITCVAHGACFNVCTGTALCGPASRSVKTISVVVKEGIIFLEL